MNEDLKAMAQREAISAPPAVPDPQAIARGLVTGAADLRRVIEERLRHDLQLRKLPVVTVDRLGRHLSVMVCLRGDNPLEDVRRYLLGLDCNPWSEVLRKLRDSLSPEAMRKLA